MNHASATGVKHYPYPKTPRPLGTWIMLGGPTDIEKQEELLQMVKVVPEMEWKEAFKREGKRTRSLLDIQIKRLTRRREILPCM